MKLPVKEAYEAYRSRDTSYDGVLFVGIKSTGIYCRPICPARRASAKNCDFFESAAEAEAAGYRPCLVCHPERPSFFSKPSRNGQPCGKDGRLPVVPRQHPSFP